MSAVQSLPLQSLHETCGARFAPFAGYSMPLSYPLGVLKEHLHVRANAGLFDVSHMGQIAIEGADAARFIELACPYRASDQAVGTARYTLFLNDEAGIIDDLIVSRLSEQRFLAVVNASRLEEDLAFLKGLDQPGDVSIEVLDRVLLALQGPSAAAELARIIPECTALSFMHVTEPKPGWLLSRSGYTGEDGFEIAMPLAEAEDFARQLTASDQVEWIGLAARDSLRLEAGLPLYGQDMDETVDPFTAGLAWAIPRDHRADGAFNGASALRALMEEKSAETRVGLLGEARVPARPGTSLFDEDGQPTGIVTSGGYGPTIEKPVAMARVPRSKMAPGTTFFAEIRGQRHPMAITRMPFVAHNYYRGE